MYQNMHFYSKENDGNLQKIVLFLQALGYSSTCGKIEYLFYIDHDDRLVCDSEGNMYVQTWRDSLPEYSIHSNFDLLFLNNIHLLKPRYKLVEND